MAVRKRDSALKSAYGGGGFFVGNILELWFLGLVFSATSSAPSPPPTLRELPIPPSDGP